MSFLERMRSEPRHVKAQYAFLGAFLCTVLIATIWTFSFSARLHETVAEEPVEESPKRVLGDVFESAKLQIGTVVESVKQMPEDTQPATSTDATEPEVVPDSKEKVEERRIILIATTTSENTQ